VSGLPELREQLLGLVAEDERVREELAADGSLFEGYHPRMREVHERNAAALEQILDQHGWPGIALAGEEGAAAAWRVAQHGIGLPAFQRRCLKLIEAAAARGDADAKHAACLDDRIAFNERRPQKYGTQFDWDERGEMSPWTLDDPREVDRRRLALGVKPLAEQIRDTRSAARWPLEHAPKDWHARQRQIEEWARSAGWIG
jgi:hypothetical protein